MVKIRTRLGIVSRQMIQTSRKRSAFLEMPMAKPMTRDTTIAMEKAAAIRPPVMMTSNQIVFVCICVQRMSATTCGAGMMLGGSTKAARYQIATSDSIESSAIAFSLKKIASDCLSLERSGDRTRGSAVAEVAVALPPPIVRASSPRPAGGEIGLELRAATAVLVSAFIDLYRTGPPDHYRRNAQSRLARI